MSHRSAGGNVSDNVRGAGARRAAGHVKEDALFWKRCERRSTRIKMATRRLRRQLSRRDDQSALKGNLSFHSVDVKRSLKRASVCEH